MSSSALYDLKPGDFEFLNMSAHPGGGTETVEVSSGEGLVEDQYEAHMRGLAVAYREPLARVLANLAEDLESAGFSKIAFKVDDALEQFVVEAQDDESEEDLRAQIKDAAGQALVALEESNSSWVDYDVEKAVKQALENIRSEMNEEDPRWDSSVLRPIKEMQEETGKFKADGITSWTLSQLLDEPALSRRFYNALEKIESAAIKAMRFGPERALPMQKKEVSPVQLDQETVQRLELLKTELKKVESKIEQVDALAENYSTNLMDPQAKDAFDMKVESIYRKYAPVLNWFLRNRDSIESVRFVDVDSANAFLSNLNQVSQALFEIKKEIGALFQYFSRGIISEEAVGESR